MVDWLYDGSYANVVVTNNIITGNKLFNVGIAIGAYVWGFGTGECELNLDWMYWSRIVFAPDVYIIKYIT